jgi:hypothetical protein
MQNQSFFMCCLLRSRLEGPSAHTTILPDRPRGEDTATGAAGIDTYDAEAEINCEAEP